MSDALVRASVTAMLKGPALGFSPDDAWEASCNVSVRRHEAGVTCRKSLTFAGIEAKRTTCQKSGPKCTTVVKSRTSCQKSFPKCKTVAKSSFSFQRGGTRRVWRFSEKFETFARIEAGRTTCQKSGPKCTKSETVAKSSLSLPEKWSKVRNCRQK